MRPSSPVAARLAIAAVLVPVAGAVDIDWTSASSIKNGASTIAYGMMGWYTGNHTGDTPGNLPDPYYWWECGSMFGTMVDYWYYTGDDTYVDVTYQAMVHQMGDDGDFMPTNQTRTEGNDDQGFWAMSSMSAAEWNFKDPGSSDGGTSWLSAVQSVFNEYAYRWEESSGPELCNGGLRWQIYSFNTGYEYKNSIANGCFFNIGARLARFTGNSSYADWAEKVYDWETAVGFITEDGIVYDGAGTSNNANCTNIGDVEWTYNSGIYLHGAAVMYNYTNGSSVWEARANAILNHTLSQFFPTDQIMVERSCEPQSACTVDSLSFKAYLARWMSASCLVMPSLCNTVEEYLIASAKGAAAQCTGTADASEGFVLDGIACGSHWNESWDGTSGVGQQMSALSAVLYSQVQAWNISTPYTKATGGTSKVDASGGSPASSTINTVTPITAGDRAGAGFLTTFALAGLLSVCRWMIKE